MKIIDSLINAFTSPLNEKDCVSFTSATLTVWASPFAGWLINVATAVFVALLTRILWELIKHIIFDFLGKKNNNNNNENEK